MRTSHIGWSSPVLVLALFAFAGCEPAAARGPDAAHGAYLATKVGGCQDCHSPRDEHGAFVAGKWLRGGPLPFQPLVPMPWAPNAPDIAGLPTLTDDQAVTFLTTGVLPGGRLPRPPMPAFRFTPADARDVVAYLRHPAPLAENPAH